MTPTQSFAHKRAEAELLIRQHAPARLQEQLIVLLRPAIALHATRADDAHIPLGASKFGGAPDVPADFEWPMWNGQPLGFLAQINLEEVAPFDVEGVLPRSGMLSFFYDFEESPFGELEDEGGWQVLHLASATQRAQTPAKLSADTSISSASITFDVVWNTPYLPPSATTDEFVERSQQERDLWWDFLKKMPKPPRHAMLGYPMLIQDDARSEAAQTLGRGSRDDWHVLLQVDTDGEIGFMWGDAGAMFYLVHRDDLAKHDFTRTWLIAQCF